MQVILTPASGEIHVKDSLRFESPITDWTFNLNKGLQHNLDAKIVDDSHPWITIYRLNTDKPVESLEMEYRGKLTLFKSKPSDMPLGFLDDSGAYLDGSVAWYPASDLPISRFNIRTQRHANWEVISAGARQTDEHSITWSSQVPHDDLYLLAGDYTLYQRQHKTLSLQVWLLAPDPELAEIYLSQSAESIDEYSELIGPYPFAKFAVIENRWQTGFGMPSFTLLGSRVMRLPFIPKSSLPHEIAHNWLR
jgi:aminopeptidase N